MAISLHACAYGGVHGVERAEQRAHGHDAADHIGDDRQHSREAAATARRRYSDSRFTSTDSVGLVVSAFLNVSKLSRDSSSTVTG